MHWFPNIIRLNTRLSPLDRTSEQLISNTVDVDFCIYTDCNEQVFSPKP